MSNLRLRALNLYPKRKMRALSLMAKAQKIEAKIEDARRSERITKWLNLKPSDFKVKYAKIERDPSAPRRKNYSQLDIDYILENARAELEIAKVKNDEALALKCEAVIKKISNIKI